ncbi:sensor histidine kinase [Paraburkholderia rhynchosiae]|uniref:histidine kinase n=1 Tax=Paraburkholderia rhynchosiae TaxID=487049 RepID=A0A2N7WK20_9BURK|nr:sensor histidine kinase [Paraburkholderia rhynchosiae]PMS29799.1 sensor histidine kinase [Paraburkholderia rhynchosiae]CAB3697252.1 Sensor protein QseC [Paraburkholderia rhynchosiae]
MMRSLRARLLAWLLVPVAVFMFVTGLMSFDAARETASLLQDNALLASARIIGEEVNWEDGALIARIPPAALEMFESPYQDQVFYRVVKGRARLLGGNPELALPSHATQGPMFYDTVLDGHPVRAVAYERELYDSGATEPVTVVVGKTQASYRAMVENLWRPQLVRQGLMLALVVALVLLGLTFELRPLIRLKDDVSDRDALQLEPIRIERLPSELRPVVDAINLCIARLKLHATTQRKFIADAAHQLRTPLALLRTQIQCARPCGRCGPLLTDALAGIRRSTAKMTEMTNQLLLLAQAESSPPYCTRARVDLAAVVSCVMEELVGAAQRRQIDLGAELSGTAYVPGSATLLTALLANLVDNAIRYTQEGGRVTAICREEDNEVVLQVIDNGPGIPAEARARVFERFYRGATAAEGTGLGLSIVREVAHSHGGTVELRPEAGQAGLVVTVRLPAWRD